MPVRRFLDRDIVDKTGIDDRFDVDLPPFSRGAQLPDALADGKPVEVNAPSIFAVLRDAGLRLEPHKQPVDIYVVDRLQPLSPN
jgi:uncharacterized protein (TIGR03435 family)